MAPKPVRSKPTRTQAIRNERTVYTNPSDLVRAVELALGSRPDVRIWRQNSGAFITQDGARHVRTGINGMADLSGILSGGRRLEVECKTGSGRQTPAQLRFGEMITRMGGVYVVVRSVEEAVAAIDAVIISMK